MTATTITVRGEYSMWCPAERATVRASVQTEGPEGEAVFARAVASSQVLGSSIRTLHDADSGPVTWWTSDSVRTWSDRPWSEGKQLPPIHRSAIEFSVKFSDFEALARWVENAHAIDGVTVDSITWDLTDATRTAQVADVRSRAVHDALAKATVFAESIGLQTLVPLALADPGMLGDTSPGGGPSAPVFARAAMRAQAFDGGGAPQLALKPEDIAVASTVDARFLAT